MSENSFVFWKYCAKTQKMIKYYKMFYVKFDNSNIYNIECCAKYIKCKKKMSDNQELSII